MFCGYRHLNVDHGYKFKQGKVCINGVEGFWSFAKERLIKHHGISKNKFLLYIKEMEWRYNHRTDNLFELIVKYMLGALIEMILQINTVMLLGGILLGCNQVYGLNLSLIRVCANAGEAGKVVAQVRGRLAQKVYEYAQIRISNL